MRRPDVLEHCKMLARILAKQNSALNMQRCLETSSFMQAKDMYTQSNPQGTGLAATEESASRDNLRDFPLDRGVDEAEISKFSAMASDWWDPRGSMAPLHSMNPTRVNFCRQAFCSHFGRSLTDPRPLQGLSVADIGSGAGLLSESLARLGGSITGVDASREAIRAAQMHAQGDVSLAEHLTYRHGTAEDLRSQGASFNGVIASEVIEHVPQPEEFCGALAGLSRVQQSDDTPQGLVIISTLNRTPRSYALAVFAAERLLGLLPVGTHDWDKFITPEELVMMMDTHDMELDQIQGMAFNPFGQRWSLTSDLAVNYIAAFKHRQ